MIQRRIVIGAGLCIAAFALVGLRLVDVTLMRGTGPSGFSDRTILARADLTDRNGELLHQAALLGEDSAREGRPRGQSLAVAKNG